MNPTASCFLLILVACIPIPIAAQSQACVVSYDSYLGDGHCDEMVGDYNIQACGWDGGDCCNSTCIDSTNYTCGVVGYNCRDIEATDYHNGECTSANFESMNDGYCDQYGFSNDNTLNKEVCDWDGGDCCPSTCEGVCDSPVYSCLDANASDYGVIGNCIVSDPGWIGDGYCDEDNFANEPFNSDACNWDGGDCCQTTCDDTNSEYLCGSSGYFCLDPNVDECQVEDVNYLGDGYCDRNDYNTAACSWDGGDCCPDKCTDTEAYTCGYNSYDCLDPSSNSRTTISPLPDGCDVDLTSYIADNYCDHTDGTYNNAACNWDGGDCCEDTCPGTPGSPYTCGDISIGYACLDPDSDYYMFCNTTSEFYGDGFCDQYLHLDDHLNSAMCNWDGGDCCESTCVGDCDSVVFDCLDPDATDYGAVSTCSVTFPSWLTDAYCDSTGGYNTEACNWDGGDCCPETCLAESHASYNCNEDNYVCLDPEHTEGGCVVLNPSWQGDGYCDGSPYNSEACDWDGGDCCQDSCSSSTWECGSTDYDCQDPLPGCRVSDRSMIGDGMCDMGTGPEYNTDNCNWDGGDCCADTCITAESECGSYGYHCINPDSTQVGICPGKSESYYGDGFCDEYRIGTESYLNTEICGWDNGDCCTDTCTTLDDSDCDNFVFNCLDPDATTVGDSSSCDASLSSWIGDSVCDADSLGYNTASCGWDGGDCCVSSCAGRSSDDCGSAGYYCINPDAPETQVINGQCFVVYDSFLGDGACDAYDTYNTYACDWDGGDCCKSSCQDSSDYICGINGWNCDDPNAGNCNVSSTTYLGDGYCDANWSGEDYNTLGCGWDGGDCCDSTCVENTYECGLNGFSCLDPDATDYGVCDGVNSSSLGDGYCDQYSFDLTSHLNTEICGWDNGDCCVSTCESSNTDDGGQCDHIVFDCLDPDATDYGASSECEVDLPEWIMDGYCDANSGNYNTAACSWDGGDCCESSCLMEDLTYDCGHNYYYCLDEDSEEWNGLDLPSGCDVEFPTWLGDGFCDDQNDDYNTDSCGWDYGDCCASKCEDGSLHMCGDIEPVCRDPTASDYFNISACEASVEFPSYYQDGYCDLGDGYNTAICDWDGGDCCEDTCQDGTYVCGVIGYLCLDTYSSTYGCPGLDSENYGNGFCDQYNYALDDHLNIAICNWDGGDCCEDTCEAEVEGCFSVVFDCLDPNSDNYGEVSDCQATFASWIGDSYCDEAFGGYNTLACAWDGGDCCESTCLQEETPYDCGVTTYICLDTDASDYNDFGDCVVDLLSYLGDGWCDASDYNTEVCAWDGGDCCEETCNDGTYSCGSATDGSDIIGYDCLDPYIPKCDVEHSSYIEDGYCDAFDDEAGYNTNACDWDGGDCCYDTCIDDVYTCGVVGYSCLNPDAQDYLKCTGLESELFGNGECDMFSTDLTLHLNVDMCAWDGGDCCISTCVNPNGGQCDNIVFDCLDPEAPDYLNISFCQAPSPEYINDGYCDTGIDESTGRYIYNNPVCGWDGGDCCPSTCVDSDYECGTNDYDCLSGGTSGTTARIDNSDCIVESSSYIGDGYCDSIDGSYNTLACSWDGGDCCYDTCVDAEYDCGSIGYSCLNPMADDYYSCVGLESENYGDGVCDQYHLDLEAHLNTEMCSWDGGDCCISTCLTSDGTECDHLVYACLDPTASDYGDISDCTASIPSYVNDGYCDTDGDYNTAVCNWDGGDCCEADCQPSLYSCEGDFDCQDPTSPEYSGSLVSDNDDYDGEDDSLTIIIIVVVVVVVIIIVIVVVVVVLKNKTKSAMTNRSSAYNASHTSRPVTMVREINGQQYTSSDF